MQGRLAPFSIYLKAPHTLKEVVILFPKTYTALDEFELV